MILHYTKHAEEKFFVLQRHGRQILKEDVNDIVKFPESVETKGNLIFARGIVRSLSEPWETVYKKDETIISILTFYPISG